MKHALVFIATIACLTAGALETFASGAVRRYALVTGANFGGSDRPELKYAVSDAENFARVLVELGGVPSGDQILLKQLSLEELVDALMICVPA